MPQIIQLGWIPVKQEYETSPVTATIKELQKKILANPQFLGHWEGVRGHGRLDATPIKGIDLFSLWSSVEAAEAVKTSPEGVEASKLWPQIVESSSHYGPVKPWFSIFSMEGDEFSKVASAPIVLFSGCYLSADVDTNVWYEKWKALTRANHDAGNISAGYVAGIHGWAIGDTDHKGDNKKVFMTVTGWENEDYMKAAVSGEKKNKVDEGLKEFGGQQHDHVSDGLDRLK